MRMMHEDKESPTKHCAFLCWAVQPEGKRIVYRIGKLLGFSDSTIRTWKNRHRWDERAEACSDHENWAVYLLRECYPAVVHRVAFAELPGALRAIVGNAIDEVREEAKVRKAIDEAPGVPESDRKAPPTPGRAKRESEAVETQLPPSTVQAVPKQAAREAAQQVQTKRRTTENDFLRGVTSAALKQIGKKLLDSENPLPVKASDIPPLVRTHQLLTGAATERIGIEGQAEQPEETVRVAQARETGDPDELLAAIRADSLETLAIVESLQARRELEERGGEVVRFPGS